MHEILVTAGVVCIIAAIVGGRFKGFGFELEALGSAFARAALGVFGLLFLAIGLHLFDSPLKAGRSPVDNASSNASAPQASPQANFPPATGTTSPANAGVKDAPANRRDAGTAASVLTGIALPRHPDKLAQDLALELRSQHAETMRMIASQRGRELGRTEVMIWSGLNEDEAEELRDDLLKRIKAAGYAYRQLMDNSDPASLRQSDVFSLAGQGKEVLGLWAVGPYREGESTIRYTFQFGVSLLK